MREAAAELHERTGRTAGNGSLMRTGPVALAHLGDAGAIVEAARAVSALTHYDPIAGDACVLWCLAIDHAVLTGELDVRVGLPHVDAATGPPLLDEAEAARAERTSPHSNGWVVAALQGAWSAVTAATASPTALGRAVSGGGDTDTVAAIAGALLGARYGASAVPPQWRRVAARLARAARPATSSGSPCSTVRGGRRPRRLAERRDGSPSTPRADASVVPHPDDPGVLLGAMGALQPGVADAVVSLCRLGTDEAALPPTPDHVEVWLVDTRGRQPRCRRRAARRRASWSATCATRARPCSCTACTRRPARRSAAAAYGALHHRRHPRAGARARRRRAAHGRTPALALRQSFVEGWRTMSWTEVAGFVTGALCVYLVVRQHIANFPIGIANNVFFFVLFVAAGLYADAGLQVVFLALGLCRAGGCWLRGGPTAPARDPTARHGRARQAAARASPLAPPCSRSC